MGNFQPYNEVHISSVAPSLFNSMFGVFNPYAALAELCDNSIDSGSPLIRIRYKSIEKVLEITDYGCGISMKEIKNVLDFGYHTREQRADKIGCHNVGLKAAMYLLINQDYSKRILTTIETVQDGILTRVEKNIDLAKNSDDNVTSHISYSESFRQNGTHIRFDGVHLSRSEYELCKLKIRARYYHLLNEGKIQILFDDDAESIKGIDMLYRDCPSIKLQHKVIRCKDKLGEFDVEITIASTDNFLKKNSKGCYKYDRKLINPLDDLQSNKTSNSLYCGVYFTTNGIYHTLGGDETWMHLGRRKHSYLNKSRVEIKLPDDRKFYIANAIKSQTRRYLRDITDENGIQIFAPVIHWFTVNSPSHNRRCLTQEDKNKKIRNAYFENNHDLIEASKALEAHIHGQYKDDAKLKCIVLHLTGLIKSCGRGYKVNSTEN